MKITARLSVFLLAATAMTAFSSAGHAQDNTETYEDEILVTATKRATSVQDVPISVTVVTPESLQNQGVASIKDLQSVASGFNIQSSQTESQGTSIRIRGVGTTGNNIGLESSVGVFIDGVYASRPGVALGELTDIEALELLKGPQGTLFGRNTSSGALNIRTKKPNFDGTSGYADFTYGNFDLINVQAGANFTASEDLAFRVNGAFRQRDGFLTSASNPDSESHNRDRFLIKGQALWEPSDATSLRIIADYAETDENCCAGVVLSASPNLEVLGLTDTIFPALGFEEGLEDLQFSDDAIWENSSESLGFSGELVHDFGFAEATLIGSYRDYSALAVTGDFNATDQYTVPQLQDDIETITAELRFQGTALDDRLDWLVGGYWANETIDEVFQLELGADYQSSVGAANFGSPAALGLLASAGQFFIDSGNPDPAIAAAAGLNFVNGVTSDGAVADNRFNQDATTLSIFTHNIFSVTDRLDLTLGARYNDDSKDGRFDQLSATNPDACIATSVFAGIVGGDAAAGNLNAFGLSNTVFNALVGTLGPDAAGLAASPAATGPGAFINCFGFSAPTVQAAAAINPIAGLVGVGFLPQEFDDNFSDSEFIYTAKLDYDVTDDLLVYGSFAHGYKAGGFNLDVTAAVGGADPRFASEEVDSFELGFKSTLADGRVKFNLTGFYSTYDNFQVLEFTGTQFQTFNVDDVSSKGFEADLNASLSDSFSLNGSFTYADSAYGEDCDDGGAIAAASLLCGFDLTNAPKVSFVLGGTYDGEIGDSGWGLLANVNMSSQSEVRTSTSPQAAPGVLNQFDNQAGYTKVNARVGFSMPNDRASIEFWGTNLTDERTRSITFNTPLQGASRGAFTENPRQYGVTVRTNF